MEGLTPVFAEREINCKTVRSFLSLVVKNALLYDRRMIDALNNVLYKPWLQ